MKMHVLSGGRLRMRRNVYIPEAAREETIDLPVSCYLLRHAQGNVLFDTGCHPSTSSNPAARWGTMAKAMTPIGAAHDNLIDQLHMVGLTPLDIDVVINSHFHTDHCGCNEFFTRSTVICHANELANAQAADAQQKGFLAIDWRQPMPLETIAGERDLYGDGRIVLLPMPGHTPGMTAAQVVLDRDGAFLLASDAAALQSNLEREQNPRQTWDPQQATKSMQEIARIRDSGVAVIYGHDLAQWATLRKGNDAYQ
jgi:N-acyl homoserine lactone hydrolase